MSRSVHTRRKRSFLPFPNPLEGRYPVSTLAPLGVPRQEGPSTSEARQGDMAGRAGPSTAPPLLVSSTPAVISPGASKAVKPALTGQRWHRAAVPGTSAATESRANTQNGAENSGSAPHSRLNAPPSATRSLASTPSQRRHAGVETTPAATTPAATTPAVVEAALATPQATTPVVIAPPTPATAGGIRPMSLPPQASKPAAVSHGTPHGVSGSTPLGQGTGMGHISTSGTASTGSEHMIEMVYSGGGVTLDTARSGSYVPSAPDQDGSGIDVIGANGGAYVHSLDYYGIQSIDWTIDGAYSDQTFTPAEGLINTSFSIPTHTEVGGDYMTTAPSFFWNENAGAHTILAAITFVDEVQTTLKVNMQIQQPDVIELRRDYQPEKLQATDNSSNMTLSQYILDANQTPVTPGNVFSAKISTKNIDARSRPIDFFFLQTVLPLILL